MWQDKLKEAGVSIHVIATGGGAGLQGELWAPPGSSVYLSGASFPYSPEEQEELLGFMPEHFCSQEAAVDLASAAYMKAYQFGGKKPVGVGITASVASEKVHRGEHQVFVCVMTDDKVNTLHQILDKGVGQHKRYLDGKLCDDAGLLALIDTLHIAEHSSGLEYQDATQLATERFLIRRFFTAEGKRYQGRMACALDPKRYILIPGAFNPPHEGHYGAASSLKDEYGLDTIFEITRRPPHKDVLSVQEMLKRAKLLQGHDRLFTHSLPYYIDKAREFPGMPIFLGADAMVRLLDPKWSLDITAMFQEFKKLKTTLYIGGRDVDGKFITRDDIIYHSLLLTDQQGALLNEISKPVNGEWHISSSEIRNKLL